MAFVVQRNNGIMLNIHTCITAELSAASRDCFPGTIIPHAWRISAWTPPPAALLCVNHLTGIVLTPEDDQRRLKRKETQHVFFFLFLLRNTRVLPKMFVDLFLKRWTRFNWSGRILLAASLMEQNRPFWQKCHDLSRHPQVATCIPRRVANCFKRA